MSNLQKLYLNFNLLNCTSAIVNNCPDFLSLLHCIAGCYFKLARVSISYSVTATHWLILFSTKLGAFFWRVLAFSIMQMIQCFSWLFCFTLCNFKQAFVAERFHNTRRRVFSTNWYVFLGADIIALRLVCRTKSAEVKTHEIIYKSISATVETAKCCNKQ